MIIPCRGVTCRVSLSPCWVRSIGLAIERTGEPYWIAHCLYPGYFYIRAGLIVLWHRRRTLRLGPSLRVEYVF